MKLHPIATAESLDLSKPRKLPCGVTLRKPRVALYQDYQERPRLPERSSLRDCSTCWDAVEMLVRANLGVKWIYVLGEGQEVRDLEGG